MRPTAAAVSLGILAVLAARAAAAQGSIPAESPTAPPVIRISVDAIQLDAVITDKKGRHVTDLRRDEIEIFQDGEKQEISEFSYVRAGVPAPPSSGGPAPQAPSPVGQAAAAPGAAAAAEARPTPPRTVLIVLDDLSFGPHAFDRTIRSLRHAVDRLDPKDRVDIVTTSAGFQTLTLTTDRKANRDAIEAVRRTPWTRAELANVWAPQSAVFGPHRTRFDGSVFDNVDDWMALRSIAAVKVAVKALRDVPGRKALLLVSEGLGSLRNLTLPQVQSIYWPLDRLYGDANDLFGALKRLAELAARSGVVIHAVDPRGLVTAGLGVEDSIWDIHDPRAYGNAVAARHVSLNSAQSTLQYLTDETGGLTRVDDNDMAASFASIVDDLSGYYLIGYTPRSGTFDSGSFHRFEAKVKRPGLKVRTREGFYPVTDEQVATALR